ncbi:MAG: response regulator, partial [Pirellulales bacterium]|nr:response regulator [Pirellulales bacterium]
EMPRMSGLELCRRVHQRNPEIPLFLITGHQLELSARNVEEELQIAQIFGKPFSPTKVIATVRRAITDRFAEIS